MSRRPREFLHPVPLLAVVLMAVNDRWLKPHHPGLLSGKLSDFAICFFLPLYLSAVLALLTGCSLRFRVMLGCAATVAIFGAIKLSTTAASLFCGLLSAIGAPLCAYRGIVIARIGAS